MPAGLEDRCLDLPLHYGEGARGREGEGLGGRSDRRGERRSTLTIKQACIIFDLTP